MAVWKFAAHLLPSTITNIRFSANGGKAPGLADQPGDGKRVGLAADLTN
jgi:hypothetical protein